MLTEDRNRQSDDRLRMKTQEDTLMRAAMDGVGLSPWRVRALPELVEEIYSSQCSDADPLRDGQPFYQCTALEDGKSHWQQLRQDRIGPRCAQCPGIG